MKTVTLDAFKRTVGQWPKDPLRPQLQFKELLKYIGETTPDKVTPGMVVAVKALKDDTLMHKYRLTPKMTKPVSMPEHYNRMMMGYENAKQGKRRSWWNIIFGIYK